MRQPLNPKLWQATVDALYESMRPVLTITKEQFSAALLAKWAKAQEQTKNGSSRV